MRRYSGTDGTVILVRCLFTDIRNPQTSKGRGVDGYNIAYNCSAYNCDETGLHDGNFVADVSNCICLGNGTDYYVYGAGTRDKNMSSDTSAPGTTTYHSEVATSIWTDPANDNFTLKVSTNAINNGNTIAT